MKVGDIVRVKNAEKFGLIPDFIGIIKSICRDTVGVEGAGIFLHKEDLEVIKPKVKIYETKKTVVNVNLGKYSKNYNSIMDAILEIKQNIHNIVIYNKGYESAIEEGKKRITEYKEILNELERINTAKKWE